MSNDRGRDVSALQEASFTSEPVEKPCNECAKIGNHYKHYNMKRFVIMMVLAILATSTAVAQEEEHAKFMGIELGGSIEQFESELQKKGFNRTSYDESSGVISYEGGKFTGEDVLLMAVIRCDVVSSVAVMYEPTLKWHEAKTKYDNLKKYLIQKYGDPIQESEDFGVDFYDISEKGELMESHFNIPGGKVALSIGAINSYSGAVVLFYVDASALAFMNQEKLNDL